MAPRNCQGKEHVAGGLAAWADGASWPLTPIPMPLTPIPKPLTPIPQTHHPTAFLDFIRAALPAPPNPSGVKYGVNTW